MMSILLTVVHLAVMLRVFTTADLPTPSITSLTHGSTKNLTQTELTKLFECLCASTSKQCVMETRKNALYYNESFPYDQGALPSNSSCNIFVCDFPSEDSTRPSCLQKSENSITRLTTYYINVPNNLSCTNSCCLILEWNDNVTLNDFPMAEMCENNPSNHTSGCPDAPKATNISCVTLPSGKDTTEINTTTSSTHSSPSETNQTQDESDDDSTLILAACLAGGIAIIVLVIGICLCKRRKQKKPSSINHKHSLGFHDPVNEYSEIGAIGQEISDDGRNPPTGREQNEIYNDHRHSNSSNNSDCVIPITNDSPKGKDKNQANEYNDLNEICSDKNEITTLPASSNSQSSYETIDKTGDVLSPASKTKEGFNHGPLTDLSAYEDVDLDNIKLQERLHQTFKDDRRSGNTESSGQGHKEDLHVDQNYDILGNHKEIAEGYLATYNEGSESSKVLDNIVSSEKERDGCEGNEYNRLKSSKGIHRREGITDSFLGTYGQGSATPRNRSDSGIAGEEKVNEYSKLSNSKSIGRSEGITDSFLKTYGRSSSACRDKSGSSEACDQDKMNEYDKLSSGKGLCHREGISDSFLRTYGPASARSSNQVATTKFEDHSSEEPKENVYVGDGQEITTREVNSNDPHENRNNPPLSAETSEGPVVNSVNTTNLPDVGGDGKGNDFTENNEKPFTNTNIPLGGSSEELNKSKIYYELENEHTVEYV